MIGKLFDKPRGDRLAELTTLFHKENQDFSNRTGVVGNAVTGMWTDPDKDEHIVSCHWHLIWTIPTVNAGA